MKAMLLRMIQKINESSKPLQLDDLPDPVPGPGEVLVKVAVCGVCHTELDEIEGRTPPENLPLVPGHQVVGRIVSSGPQATRYQIGKRVGIAWIYSTCGECEFCRSGRENLCASFRATGRDVNGGYAEFMRVPESYVYPIPDVFTDAQAAPLLCAGAIGYRSLALSRIQDGQALGMTGFGSSGHLVLQMVRYRYPNVQVAVFARSAQEREIALEMGATWAGEAHETPPNLLHAIIDTTPVWKPVVEALRCLIPGGRLVINAIRKEDLDQASLLELDYPLHLWMEKEIKSVANVTRRDVSEFLDLAASVPIRPAVQEFALEDANRALIEMKTSHIRGAKVLRVA